MFHPCGGWFPKQKRHPDSQTMSVRIRWVWKNLRCSRKIMEKQEIKEKQINWRETRTREQWLLELHWLQARVIGGEATVCLVGGAHCSSSSAASILHASVQHGSHEQPGGLTPCSRSSVSPCLSDKIHTGVFLSGSCLNTASSSLIWGYSALHLHVSVTLAQLFCFRTLAHATPPT